MPVVEFEVTGAGKVPAENEAIAASQKKVNHQQEKTNRNYRNSAAEAKRFARIAQQVARQNETAQERYNRKLSEAKKALAGHAQETVLLKRETTRLRIELLKEEDANKRIAASRKKAVDQAKSDLGKLPPLVQTNTKAYEKQTGQVVLLGKSLKEVDTASTAAFGEASLARLGQFVLGLVGVQKAVGAIGGEIQAQQELADRQAATQLSVAQSRNVVRRNLVSKSEAERKYVAQQALAIQASSGVSEQAVNAGLASALSSSGGRIGPSVKATSVTAQFLQDRPNDIGLVAGTLLDLQKVTGTDDARVNLGLLSRIGELGRVVDPGLQAENIAPALIGAQSFGGTARGSGALFAGLTSAAGDTQGRRTGTAVIALAQQLRDFDGFAGVGTQSAADRFNGANSLVGKGLAVLGTLRDEALSTGYRNATLTGRIKLLQDNPEIARAFLGDASFEKKTVGPIEDLLLRPDSVAAQEFDRNLGLIPENPGLRIAGEKALGVFAGNTLEARARTNRAITNAADQASLLNTDTVSSEERSRIVDLIAQSNRLGVGGSFLPTNRARLTVASLAAGDGAVGLSRESAIDALELGRPTNSARSFTDAQGNFIDSQFSREELELDRIMKELIEELRRGLSADAVDKQTTVLEEIRDDIKEGGFVGVAE